MAVKLRLVHSSCGIRNVLARMPFRFGVITMRAAPLLTLAVEIEDATGRTAAGYAADFLAYRWFDKRPHKSLAGNCRDLLACVDDAQGLYLEAGKEGYHTAFALWRETSPEIERQALARDFNRLGASFGASMLERGVIDALGRMTGQPFAALVRDGLGIDLGSLCEELCGREIAASLPERPLARLRVRHTVGLIDPITAADRRDAAVDDGLPETLEDYLDQDGIRYLKIKVSGRLDEDIARLEAIAALLERRDRAFHISLDGNEQYRDPGDFLDLMARIKATPALGRLYAQIMFIEQPLDRAVALDLAVKPALAVLSRDKPVIIDEADGWLTAFREAIDLGYRGTSHKNCKGIYKSLHNMALACLRNERAGRLELFLSAEDLSNVPVVALQADLAVVAALGITHVERNGHHYFRGLGHLGKAEKAQALERHADLYERHGDEVFLRIADGGLDCASLQVPGMGFAALPDMASLTPADRWDFSSLGVDD